MLHILAQQHIFILSVFCAHRYNVAPQRTADCHARHQGQSRGIDVPIHKLRSEGGGVRSLAPATLSPGNKPGTHFSGSFVGLGDALDGYRKFYLPTFRTLVRPPLASLYTPTLRRLPMTAG